MRSTAARRRPWRRGHSNAMKPVTACDSAGSPSTSCARCRSRSSPSAPDRPAGLRVALLEAIVEADGQEVLHARGWRIALPGGAVPVIPGDVAPPPVPDPVGSQLPPRLPNAHTDGYLAAIEWRFIDGGFGQLAPGRAWTRPGIPLVAGENASPMCRALLVADSGSGVGAVLDPARFTFINVDLTVGLPRDPAGDWLLLEAMTTTNTQGTGVAETALSDTSGRCGTAIQTLLVAPRG